ncbi:MAG TPA: RHS repeat-associated core domain-containing protein, partial [Paucimonas sp.]|nr:RHS repeat-associated core domain-containing protein [Paucimonas sp.]
VHPATGATECLPKTTFEWGQGGAPSWKTLPMAAFTLPRIGGSKIQRYQGNLDATGRTSLIAAELVARTDSTEGSTVGTGDTGWHLSGKLSIRLPNGQVIERTLDLAAIGLPPDIYTGATGLHVGDLDGDDRDDLVPYDSFGAKWGYCLNTPAADGTPSFTCHGPFDRGVHTMADLRNIGKMRLLRGVNANGDGESCTVAGTTQQCTPFRVSGDLSGWTDGLSTRSPIHFSAGGAAGFYAVRNTDGMQLPVTSRSTACFHRQDGLHCQSVAQASIASGHTPVKPALYATTPIGDLNGDGHADFVYTLTNAGADTGAYLCLSKETGLECQRDAVLTPYVTAGGTASYTLGQGKIGDFLGDGVNRLLFAKLVPEQPAALASVLCRYTAAGFACQEIGYSPAARENHDPVQVDESGLPAFFAETGAEENNLPLFQTVTLVEAPEQDRLVGVTNGVGYREEVSYARGDDGAVYGRTAVIDGEARLPAYPKKASMPDVLVKEVRRSNGQGGWLRSAHRYEGAQTNIFGRGSLGFGKVTVTDVASGIATELVLVQGHPYTGRLQRSRTISSTGVVMNDTRQQWDRQILTWPNGKQTTFVYGKQTIVARKDLYNRDLSTTTTDNQYGDGWGNLTRQDVSVSGNGKTFASSTVNTYRNDSAAWLLGLLETGTVTKTDPAAGSITRNLGYAYEPASGLLKSETIEPNDPALRVMTSYERNNAFGLVNRKIQAWTDPATGAPQTRTLSDTTYDARGRFAVTVKNALNHAETRTFHAGTGAQASLTGPNGLTTAWTVDGFGRTTKELRADGNETRQYRKQCQGDCPAGAVVASISDSFHGNERIAVPQVTYSDAAGHVLRTQTWGFDGRIIVTDQRYDGEGRLHEVDQPRYVADPARLASRMAYDALDRVVSVTSVNEAGGEQVATTEYRGLVTTLRNAKGQARVETRDALGRVVNVLDAKFGNTRFDYDAFGNLIKTTDPNGNVVTVTYDRLGRKTDLRDPDLGWIHYDIDPPGRTWKQTSPVQRSLGQSTRFEFDALDRMTGRYEPDLESHWVYDTAAKGIGQLAEAYTGTPSVKDYRRLHTYDNLGRAGTTSIVLDAVYTSTPEYDAWGRTIRQTHRRGTDAAKVYDLRYNEHGYLARLERGSLVLWQVDTQDAAQRIVQASLGNGLTQSRGYNAHTGRIDHGVLKAATGKVWLQEGYQYDALGNVTQRTQYVDNVGFTESFGYDELNRLTGSQVAGQMQYVYRYDAAGNLIYKTGAGEYVYPSQGPNAVRPHAVQSMPERSSESFGYDANGNLTNGLGRSITWTSFDMPKSIRKGSEGGTFVYGPEHQRTVQVRYDAHTIRYAGAMETDTSGSGVTVKTYWPLGVGVEIDRPGATSTELNWTHTDRLGSVVALTGQDGSVREGYSYDAWGMRRWLHGSLNGSPTGDHIDGAVDSKGYTGHEMLDTVDLVHMNGRVYDPFVARFLSADPLIQDPTNGQNYSRYSYVYNNPTNLIDPTGFATQRPAGCDRRCQEEQKRKERCQNDPNCGYIGGETEFERRARNAAHGSSSSGGSGASGSGTAGNFASGANTTRTFVNDVAAGLTSDGLSSIVIHRGYWKEEIIPRYYGTAGEIWGQWMSLNPFELIARDLGASRRLAFWIGMVSAIGNPKQLLQGAAKGINFFRGAKPGAAPSFVPRENDFKVDPMTGFVKDTHGVSVFDNAASVSSKGFVPHQVDLNSVPDSLRIIQRGADPHHFEIVPQVGANLTPQQFINACSSIVCK